MKIQQNIIIFITILITLFGNILSLTAQNKLAGGGGTVGPPEYFNIEVQPIPSSSIFQDYSGFVSVNHFTGSPQLGIPLFTLKSGKFKHNVSLSYSSNGIQPANINNPVRTGQSWQLNAGGVINRTMNCLPDEHWYLQSAPNDILYSTLDEQLELTIINRAIDFEPDIFSFSFDGYSGEFCFAGEMGNKEVMLMPRQNLKVEMETDDSNRIIAFTITTPDGTKYLFGSETAIEETTVLWPKSYNYYISAWFLTEIISAEGNSVFQFEYADKQISTISGEESSRRYTREWDSFIGNFNPNGVTNNPGSLSINTKYLTKIIGNNHYIEFNAFEIETINLYENNNLNPKKSITIQKQPVGLFSLISKVFYHLESTIEKKFQFNYYEGVNTNSNPKYSQDLWGYYNAASNTDNSFVPKFDFSHMPNQEGTGIRDNGIERIKTGMLKEVIFPTGGLTELNYKMNRFLCESNEETWWSSWLTFENVGEETYIVGNGLSVSSLINKDGNGEITKEREFTYEEGQQFSVPTFLYYSAHTVNVDDGTIGGTWKRNDNITINPNPITPISKSSGAQVGYKKVREYNGTKNNNMGYTEYEFSFEKDDYNDFPSYSVSKSYLRGRVELKDIYALTVENNYFHSETNNPEPEFFPKTFVTGKDVVKGVKAATYMNDPSGETSNEFSSVIYYLRSETVLENNLIKTTFYKDGVQPVIETIDFEYSTEVINSGGKEYSVILQNKQINTLSDGQIISLNYKYPFDYNVAPMTDMCNKFIISPVIDYYKADEQNKLISGIFTEFENLGSKGIQPKRIYTTTNSAPVIYQSVYPSDNSVYQINSTALKYDDYGNIVEYKKENDITVSVFWGYNNSLPIAKITGIAYDEISLTVKQNIDILDNGISNEWLDVRNALIRSQLPDNVFVDTYTYDPLIGMTTQTDPNCNTTYYEYDDFGRLKLMKNQDGNIIKTYEYNYKHEE